MRMEDLLKRHALQDAQRAGNAPVAQQSLGWSLPKFVNDDNGGE